jgi:hypothetical protein
MACDTNSQRVAQAGSPMPDLSLVAFHGAPTPFDHFDYDRAPNPDNHANGKLGFWITTMPGLAEHFGAHVLRLEIVTTERQIFRLDIDKLSAMSHLSEEDHAQFRQDLLAKGYRLLLVVETDGTFPTMVLLDETPIISKTWSQTKDAEHNAFQLSHTAVASFQANA